MEKNQFYKIFIKYVDHKHNTMLPCHVIVAAKYSKSHFEQNKIHYGVKILKNGCENY